MRAMLASAGVETTDATFDAAAATAAAAAMSTVRPTSTPCVWTYRDHFRELVWKTLIFLERTVPISPNAWCAAYGFGMPSF
jgi:hypothetical protein